MRPCPLCYTAQRFGRIGHFIPYAIKQQLQDFGAPDSLVSDLFASSMSNTTR